MMENKKTRKILFEKQSKKDIEFQLAVELLNLVEMEDCEDNQCDDEQCRLSKALKNYIKYY